MTPSLLRGRRAHLGGAVAALLATALLTACQASADQAGADDEPPGVPLPSEHVHAVGVDPADDRVYLATHDGLFDLSQATPERVGPVIDLMGFTVAGPKHFYASGHPGARTDLPQPVGLLETRDAGRTWTSLSRGGVSDFHTLTVSSAGVAGFDGFLRTSVDGVRWTDSQPPAAPFDLAASPDGATLLATTEQGPMRSADGGTTWSPLDAPLLLLAEWADATTIVGATPDGVVYVSDDAGDTWRTGGDVGAPPQALAARGDGGSLRVLVVTTTVLESLDGGATFEPPRPPA